VDVDADENPHFTNTREPKFIFFPNCNWYIRVVLLYVMAACVRSNKRYSNPVAY